ncbi:hypothetical protein KC238_26085, partial [Mycobacteroides chelonae]
MEERRCEPGSPDYESTALNHYTTLALQCEEKGDDKSRQHLKKQRHHLANKGLYSIVKAMVFPVVMYGSESWTIKKADRRRIDAFELWCWRRLLRVPWTVRRSNLSILKEISPESSLEGQILKPPHEKR